MIDPAYAVAYHLLDAYSSHAIGTFAASTGWSINVSQMPKEPDTAIAVSHTGGLAPFPNIALDQPSIQVMVRGAADGYQAAKNKILQVKDVLLGLTPQVLGTTVSPVYAGDAYQSCIMLGDIIDLGQDDNNRPHFSANFRFIVLPVASGNRVAIT